MIKFVLLISLLTSSVAFATGMYKCTSKDGSFSFQELPCSSGEDTEKIEVNTQKASSGPHINYYPTQPPQEEPSKAWKSYQKSLKKYRRDRKERWDKYYREKCERYTSSYDMAKDAWREKMHSGYQERDKIRMLGDIESTKNRMNYECAEKFDPDK